MLRLTGMDWPNLPVCLIARAVREPGRVVPACPSPCARALRGYGSVRRGEGKKSDTVSGRRVTSYGEPDGGWVADVFISYKREERQAVERLAQELRRLGLDVWFDARLEPGKAFTDEIVEEIDNCRAMLVCWSPSALASEYVRGEADLGRQRGVLVQAMISHCRLVPPFNSLHAVALDDWLAHPVHSHSGWKRILQRIGALCGREDIESYGALDVQAAASVLRAWLAQHEASPLFMAVDELLRARDVEEAEGQRLEQEARERRGREEAERRAREEASRRARGEQERGEQEGGARQESEAQAARDADAPRATRRVPWWLIVGGVVVATLVVGIMLNAGQEQVPETDLQQPQAEEAAPTPVQARVDQSIPLPEMVRIPGRNFEAGRYEVTFAQWDACVAAGGCNGYRPDDQGWGRGNHPVINVNWNDAQAYAQWLSQRTRQRYRLLTEAEWEIAARAGSTTNFSWGDEDPVCDHRARNGANFRACTGDRPLPVGSFQPNAFGLYDVHGNVIEWVEDCYDPSCSSRILRGGSWYFNPETFGSAVRFRPDPTLRNFDVGFRVARTV